MLRSLGDHRVRRSPWCERSLVVGGRVDHPIYRVRDFEIVGPYVLHVAFDDGTVQTIDFEPVLAGELFGPLRDPALFRQGPPHPHGPTPVLPNRADFHPATLHHRPGPLETLLSPGPSRA